MGGETGGAIGGGVVQVEEKRIERKEGYIVTGKQIGRAHV